MRVVAGRFGGRRLAAPPGRATRPTSDRVREALFSILGPLDGARVLDLYAGSGALAIEALSRGAQSAVLVERDRRAVAAIRANLDALGVAEPEARLVAAPARAALKNARAAGDTYDLVFVDPPYRSAPELGRELSDVLGPLLAAGGRVVTESDRRAPLELSVPLTLERRYGDTLIRIHTHGT
ncbi:MAG: rRNA (guanine966-N2)-methyltransferase [Solirubrobacteraceae bacterium]|nr:rRNA (guanine966-N2)-methyltransferase [Solirubrobacteraceae bacterium]